MQCLSEVGLYRGDTENIPMLLTDHKYILQDSLKSIVYEWGEWNEESVIEIETLSILTAGLGAMSRAKAFVNRPSLALVSFLTQITV